MEITYFVDCHFKGCKTRFTFKKILGETDTDGMEEEQEYDAVTRELYCLLRPEEQAEVYEHICRGHIRDPAKMKELGYEEPVSCVACCSKSMLHAAVNPRCMLL